MPAAPAEAAAPAALRTHHSLVAGRELTGRAGLRPVVSPASGEPFAQASLLDLEQATGAIAAAQAAFPAWSALPFRERSRVLSRARALLAEEAEELARLIAREQGKPVAEAHAVELFPALETLKHLAAHGEDALREEPLESEVLLFGHKQGRLLYAPHGVVLVITPWNYPFLLSMAGVATALAAGNTVVFKPAPATTLVGLRLADLFRRAGLPDGALSALAVDDTLAAALVEDPRISKIVFTGSVATGRRVMASAARNLTPVVLELGGKDPAIVCRDADLERAARGIAWGAFVNCGQTCASVERVYVEAPVAEEFVAKVAEEARRLRVGDPLADGTDVGPMTLERQRRIVEEHVADALARGARALVGGVAPEGPGWFYPPTVLVGVDHTMRVMREESFGPLLPVMSVASLDEAIRLANDSEYGLTASGWTRSPETARLLQERLQAGAVTINDCVSSAGEPGAPWGGVKHSGIGRAHGRFGLREMVQVKYASRDHADGRALWWYPYGSEYRRLMATALRALYAGGVARRLAHLARLLGFRRFFERVRILDVLRNVDRLF